jgi:Rab-GTPase-TBC domain
LGVIEKDLNRLQPDHHTYHHSRKNYQSPGREISFDDSKRERSKVLTEILHVYAREHPHIGYRQGMHEIASYLLLTLEMDLFDQESALEQLPPTEGGELLDTNYLAADAYYMMKSVMSSLQGAYDVKQHSADASPMEAMAKSILSKLKDTACDKTLYDHVTRMNCPPELYCTRWVRLMFSREVEGWRNVLVFWDIILDLISLDGTISSMVPSRYTRPGISPPLTLGEFPLMQVLEAAAASMILLQRSQLLSAEDPNESIHTLMNVPPLKNILPLTATLLSMMRRIQLKDTKNVSSDSSTTEESRSQKPSRTATILQSAQNAIRDISLGTVSPATFRLGLKAETFLTTRSEIPAVPTLEESNNHWRGSLRKLSFPKQEPAPQSPTPLRTVARPHAAADDTLTRSEMAMTLNQGIFTIRNFLTSLETVAGDVSTSVVPQSVWTALEEVDTVRQDLLVERPGPKKGLKGHTV